MRPEACDACLRRALLIAAMAPLIETASANKPGSRTPELLALADRELARAVARPHADDLLSEARSHDLAAFRGSMGKADGWALCRHAEGYPEAFRGDDQAPAALFGRGEPALLAELEPEAAVTVVGSRRPSRYGIEVARSLGAELAAAGLSVISGMALGIDSRAQQGALDTGGRTVAVLGSGPDVPHPPSGRRLYERIVERGLVLSELPPGTRPFRWTFPARNRIMAALAEMTVVVEAAEQSGSLITARMASDLGREVGAVPGRVGTPLAAGTNALLADGAVVVRGAQDVLDAMLGPGASLFGKAEPKLTAEQREVFDLVGRGHETADAVATAAQIPVAEAGAALLALELAGAVVSDQSGRYSAAA